MMHNIKLISDSTCDLSLELLAKFQIDQVPLYVNFQEESFLDGVNLHTEEMYSLIKEKNVLPKTAAASPGSFLELFEKNLAEGYQIIYIGIGSKFSATFTSAFSAKKITESEDIFLIDSENLSSGSGLLLLKAAKFREEGFTATEIVEKIKAIIPKVRSQFVIDTLDYLYKGGRLNALSTIMGTVLRIKPIIKVRNGEMVVGKKGRGSIKHGIDLMLQEIISSKVDIDLDFCMITHSMSDENVTYIQNIIHQNFEFNNVFITNAGCVISSHCGKGTIGVLYILK